MASNITVSGLAATPGIGHIGLQWSYSDPNANGLPYRQLETVELWAASSNDRSAASKVAEGRDSALHVALVEGTTYYYWIKPRDCEGGYGDWYPSSSTGGVLATVGFAAGASQALINGQIVATVAANALTIAVKTLSGDDPSAANPVFIGFRTQAGSYVVRSITAALSLVISSGSTLGSTSDDPFRIWVVVFDDGGTLRLGARNCSTPTAIFALAEFGYGSSTAEGGAGAADSAGVFYTGSAVTTKPFRIVGFLDWNDGLAAAGTWSAEPDIKWLFGPGTKTPGDIVQLTEVGSGAQDSGSTQIPNDGTIPQNDEGDEYFSLSVTPASPCNWLEHKAQLFGSSQQGLVLTLALFKDSEADAFAVSTGDSIRSQTIQHAFDVFKRMLARSTSAQAFALRAGENGAVPVFYLNNHNGSAAFGGVLHSYYSITERMG